MKKTITTLMLLLCLLMTISKNFAQKHFVNGYLITLKGDTLRGQIDDKEWEYTPQNFEFKSLDGQLKIMKATDFKEINLTDKEVYVSSKISLDVTPFEFGQLLTTPEQVIVEDTTVVLKQLVKGKISLFHLKDAVGKVHFFVQKEDNLLQELTNHRFLKMIEGKQYLAHYDVYNEQLSELCRDCSLYQQKNFHHAFTEASLVPVILKYNNFFGSTKAKVVSKKQVNNTSFFIKVGYGSYSYHSETNLNTIYDKSGLLNYSIGGGVFLELPSLRRRVGLNFDVFYSYYQELAQVYSLQFAPPKDVSYIGIGIAPRYSFYKSVDAQKSASFVVGGTVEIPLKKHEGTLYEPMGTFYGGRIGLIGKINRFEADLSLYHNTGGMHDFIYVSGSFTKIGLSISYYLK